MKFEWGKTPEKTQLNESITNYAATNKPQPGKILFLPPTVRSADGKVISKLTGGFEAVIAPERASTKKDTVKKLRLKVTSGNTSTITDQLKLDGSSGKPLVYTAQTLTAQDKKELKQKFGIEVETTTASASTTSIIVLPPPPPPVEKPSSAKKPSKLPPPPPPVEKSTKSSTATPSNLNVSDFKYFKDLGQYIKDNFNYPAAAIANKTAGYTSIGFKINNDQTLSNAHFIETLSPEIDAALLKCFNSYKMPFTAKPGNYTMGFILALNGSVIRDSLGRVKGFKGINLGKNTRTGKGSITIMLTEKRFEYTLTKR